MDACSRLVFAVLAFACVLVVASGAAAGGGSSIAGAPMIRLGPQQTQNTQSDQTARGDVGSGASLGCWNDHEFWRVQLNAGDAVLLRGVSVSPGHNFAAGFFAPGTTDRNLGKAAALVYGFPDKRAIRFIARTSGTYPIVAGPNCYDGTDGGFKFTVTTKHSG
jgi:hypothetical protein